MRNSSGVDINGVHYSTFTEVAKSLGVTYESIRSRVASYTKKGLIGKRDVKTIGGTRFLTPKAVEVLEQNQRAVVVEDSSQKAEIEALKSQIESLNESIRAFAPLMQATLEQKDNAIKELATAKAELSQIEDDRAREVDELKREIERLKNRNIFERVLNK